MSTSATSPTRPVIGDPTTFKLRKSITLGDPTNAKLPTISCPDSSYVTRIDIRTADSGTASPIRQFVKGLRMHCSSDPLRARGSINWDSGSFNDSSDGPGAANGIRDVVVGAGAVIDHVGYSNYVKGNANVSWRQVDDKALRECVLSEVGGSASASGAYLASLTLGFACPDQLSPAATTSLGAPTGTAAAGGQSAECATGLGVGAILGIVSGFAVLNAAAIAFMAIRLRIIGRQKQQDSDGTGRQAKPHRLHQQPGDNHLDGWKPAPAPRPMSEELILAPPPPAAAQMTVRQ